VGARTKARKRAVDVLFEADQRGLGVLPVLEARLLLSGTQTPLPAYTETLVRGVASRWHDLEVAIGSAVEGEWTLSRMPAVDRAILRVGAWEILASQEVAPAVAIDQAVELAKSLSTDESPAFINGVLGAIARDAHGSVDPRP